MFQAASMTRGIYEDAFAAAPAAKAGVSPEVLLVNHHLLAAHLIAQAVSSARTDAPVTTVLISPDHFDRGRAPITTAAVGWQTPYGDLLPDTAVLKDIDSYVLPFAAEHGVANIVGFIKREIPGAKIIPILVKDGASPEMTAGVAEQLANLPGRVLVIGSFDFTHEATREKAVANDAVSLGILRRGETDAVGKVAVDSHGGLRLLMQYAKLRGLKFELLANTNSSFLADKPEQTDVTSYITGFWTR